MIYWTAKLAGWLLVALGLAAFWKVYEIVASWGITSLEADPDDGDRHLPVPRRDPPAQVWRSRAGLPGDAAAAVSRRLARVGPAAGGANAVPGELAAVTRLPASSSPRDG